MTKSYFASFPYARLGLFAIPLLFFVVLMGQFFPSIKIEGFGSFIIAFEFVTSPDEINNLFGLLSTEEIQGVDTGNYIDFGFMLVYCGFIFMFWKANFKKRGGQTLRFGYLLVAAALLGDVFENIQLLNISSLYGSSHDYQPFLDRLQWLTWVKWEALAILFAGISTTLFVRGTFSKIIGGLLMFPFLLSLGAFGGQPVQVYWFTTSIFGAFGLLIVYCFGYKGVDG